MEVLFSFLPEVVEVVVDLGIEQGIVDIIEIQVLEWDMEDEPEV